MLKSLFEYVVGLSKANMVTIDGVVYTDKPLHLPELPTIETLHTDNLSSIVNFIKNAWDAGMNNDDDIVQKIIHVEDARKVNLYSSVCNEYMDRQKFMTAEWAGNKFPFGQFMDAEKFNILLQTCFMTPPFGFALFYIKGIVPPSVKIQEIYRGVIPFILIIIAVVILVTVFPQIVYFLPNLVAS